MDIIEKYFKEDLYQGMYKGIREFLTSFEIKEGKFEGNEVFLDKLNRESVIVSKVDESKDVTFEHQKESCKCNIDELVELLDFAMEEESTEKKRDLALDRYRIIKIGKEALFEFIYESFIDKQEIYLDVEPTDVIDSFDIDFAKGSFIFMVRKSEDENGKIVPFPKEINLRKLLRRMKDTTDTMFSDNRYIELSLDEIISLQGNKK